MAGDKALLEVDGAPLIAWPLAALGAVLADVLVVARADSALPTGLGVDVWTEPGDTSRHPLRGIVHALRGAGGRDIVVCAVDMPCVTPATVRILATVMPGRTVIAADADGRAQPLLARYAAGSLAALVAAPPDASLTATVLALDHVLLEVPDDELVNVNTAADIPAAEAALRGRRAPS